MVYLKVQNLFWQKLFTFLLAELVTVSDLILSSCIWDSNMPVIFDNYANF